VIARESDGVGQSIRASGVTLAYVTADQSTMGGADRDTLDRQAERAAVETAQRRNSDAILDVMENMFAPVISSAVPAQAPAVHSDEVKTSLTSSPLPLAGGNTEARSRVRFASSEEKLPMTTSDHGPSDVAPPVLSSGPSGHLVSQGGSSVAGVDGALNGKSASGSTIAAIRQWEAKTETAAPSVGTAPVVSATVITSASSPAIKPKEGYLV